MSSNIAEPLRKLAIAIEELHPDPANARKHNQKNLDAIKASLHAYGQRKPIVVQRQGMIVRAGNGTLEAAKALGWTHLAAVVIDEDNATASQFAIADNRTGELAEWDTETLATLLDGMDDETRDLLAFDEKDMQAMLDGLQPEQIETTEDEPPPLPEKPTTKVGDIITMGDHRLMCGDSTRADDVSQLLGDRKPLLMVTDPPYGVKYDESWRECSSNDFGGHIAGQLQNDDRCDWTEAYLLFPGDVVYVWHASVNSHIVSANLSAARLEVRQQIMWLKPFGVMSRQAYNWQHEPCWYAVRKGKQASWSGGHKETTVWAATIPNHPMAPDDDVRTIHSTQKPIEVMARAIRNHGGKDDDIYDPFLGSGTTLVAAEQLGRKCYGMEISPAYCDVIVKRWENLTGKQATRG